MSARLVFWSLTSALAGFIFGFDTVVISGAEQKIQALWSLSPAIHGMAMASALYGTVIGSLFGGWPTDRFGRKATLVAIGLLYIIGAAGSALATSVISFVSARFIGGLGIGLSTVAAPLYISEISPPKHRGLLAGTFQFNVVFGIVIAYLSNALLLQFGEDAWRLMLGVAVLPSALYVVLCLWIPESPRWLLGKKGDRSAGLKVLQLIQPTSSADAINAAADEIVTASSQKVATRKFWTRSLRVPILLAFFVAFFNQLSGINAVLYFAPRIFQMAGLGAKAAMLQSVGIGATMAVFTFIGLFLIDRLGRRTLLYIGSLGYIASLGVTAWAFFSARPDVIPFAIFAFVASHGIGQGTVIWVLISEVFPNTHRAEGQALGCFTHWILAALITTIFPKVVSVFEPGYVFVFFCSMMVFQLLWTKFAVPETKGVSLEELQRKLRIVERPLFQPDRGCTAED